jgi:flagellar L-ring protein precursor FlgH
MITMQSRALPFVLVGLLAGCAGVEDARDVAFSRVGDGAQIAVERSGDAARAVHRAATGPHLAPVNDPAALTGMQQVSMPMPAYGETPAQAPSSLWRQGARTFFNDQRATHVGDILTVKVNIEDKAQLDNTTTRDRSGTTDVGVTSLFGKEESLGRLLPPGGNFDPSSLVSANSSSTTNGTGTISRQEKIELTLAATIAQVLPNGNLVVAGRQEVRINGELRELTVAGVVRPEDIGADNSIRHDQLAEARISYGGRGTISAVQRPRWGQRVADAISPW